MPTAMRAFLVGTLLVGAVVADDAKGDAARIQGTWKVVSFQEAGRKGPSLPAAAFERMGMTIIITRDRYTVKIKDLAQSKTYRLDPTKRPPWFDLDGVKAPGGVEIGPSRGIYELNGDDLKLCLGRSGKERPTCFDPLKDPAADVVLVLKRKKP